MTDVRTVSRILLAATGGMLGGISGTLSFVMGSTSDLVALMWCLWWPLIVAALLIPSDDRVQQRHQ